MNDLKALENHIIHLVEMMRNIAERTAGSGAASNLRTDNAAEKSRPLKIIKELQQDAAKSIECITGVAKSMFPPLKKMNDAQAAFLTFEMIRLLKTFRIFADFPKKLPDHIKYIFLCDVWKEKVIYIPGSEVHLEFCNYLPFDCPFPGKHCHCGK